MGYSRAVKSSVLKKVLPPEQRSIVEVSRETGINDQTIRNWIKQSESGNLPDGSHESSPRFMTSVRRRSAVQEMREDPSKSACRRRFQTTVSGACQKLSS